MKISIHFLILLLILGPLNLYGKDRAKKMENKKNEITPGKSLGSTCIGQTLAEIKSAGFLPDESRDPMIHFKKNNVLVLLEKNTVSQIWFEALDLTALTLRGLVLPKKNDVKTLRKFFKNCGTAISGSGGVLIYCEKRGIELAYSHTNEFQGLSVLTPTMADKVSGPAI